MGEARGSLLTDFHAISLFLPAVFVGRTDMPPKNLSIEISRADMMSGLEKGTVKDVAHRIIELIRKDEWLREQPLGRIMLALLLLASGIVEVLREEENIDLSKDVLDLAKILFESKDSSADMMIS